MPDYISIEIPRLEIPKKQEDDEPAIADIINTTSNHYQSYSNGDMCCDCPC